VLVSLLILSIPRNAGALRFGSSLIERQKEFRQLDDERKAELQWFFSAMDNPELRRMIFSKGSLDKQAEFGDDFGGWMKWC
jgi:hypothetical protein